MADRADPGQLRAFLRAGSISLTYFAPDGVVLEINDVGLTRLGMKREDVVGRSIFELLPSMASVLRERFERVVSTRGPVIAEDEVPLPSGLLVFSSNVDPVLDDAGEVIAILAQSRDVTAAHQTAQSLHRANQKLSVIFEQSPYLILVYDRAGIITYINRVGPGFTMEQVLGTDSHYFVKPEFHARYDQVLSLVFDKGEPTKFEFLDVNGSWWEATLVPVKFEGRVESAISFSVDVTEKRRHEEERARIQEQLQNSQKLESLGVLAGGIAHDFNNLLLVITMNLDLAREAMPAGDEAREYLADALAASSNAADLCRQMLAYAGRGQFVIQKMDLSALVSEMAQLLSVSVSKSAQLTRELHEDLPAIEGDVTQLRQVVLNLITNASDAIGERQGTISVRTRLERLQAGPDVWSQPLTPGDYVVLEVEDTGVGIDEPTRRRMFEPFFTTKASGRGLGLSATLGILHRHKAAIAVSGKPGVGTLVRAAFPAVAGEPSAARVSNDGARTSTARELILVVDDEEGVRKAATRALTRAGYEVVVARNGREGLEQFEREADRIKLVVLDLSMPVMSGQDALVALRARAPSLRAIIMSGYSEAAVRGERLAFLAKPFAAGALVTLVDSLVKS